MAYLPTVSVAPSAVYGWRKLVSGYAGNWIRVRRSSDDTEQDIGFSGDAADTATLLTFCGAGNGFVVTWYDQSGNAANLSQATAAAQPQIVSAGALITPSGFGFTTPMVSVPDGDGMTATLAAAMSTHASTVFFAGYLADFDASTDLLRLGGANSFNWLEWEMGGESITSRIGDGSSTTGTDDPNHTCSGAWPCIQTVKLFDDAGTKSIRYWRNLSLLWTQTHTKTEATSTAIGTVNREDNAGGKYVAALVIYGDDLSDADREAVYDVLQGELDWDGPLTTEIHATDGLTEHWQWDTVLYDYIDATVEADVDLAGVYAALTWDGTYTDTDQLMQIWLGTATGILDATTVEMLRAVPDHFLLAGIEVGAGVVTTFEDEAEGSAAPALANLYALDLPKAGAAQGNPFFENAAVARRALNTSAVNAIKFNAAEDVSPGVHSAVPFAGGTMLAVAICVSKCAAELDATTLTAFKRYFLQHAYKFEWWGALGDNSNMDCKAIAALAYANNILTDATQKAQCVRAAKKILFGSVSGDVDTVSGDGIWNPGGWIEEGFSPETTYSGASLNKLAEAWAQVRGDAAWSFLGTVLERMAKFKAHQYFPDPLDYYDGPSGYAGRTGDGHVWSDQQNYLWRQATVADATEDGRFLLTDPGDANLSPLLAEAATVTAVGTSITAINALGVATEDATAAPVNWGAHNQWWPAEAPYYPDDGAYDALWTLIDGEDATTKLPYDKTDAFSEWFNGFWSYKSAGLADDFGWFVEALEDSGAFDGWYGGSLQCFWTRTMGMVVCARHDKSGDEVGENENTRVWAEIDTWACDHFWGEAATGLFSTATVEGSTNGQSATDNTEAGTPSVLLNLQFGDDSGSVKGLEAAGVIPGEFDITRTFTARADGLRVQLAYTYADSGGSDEWLEGWLTIPIYLRDAGQGIGDAKIHAYDSVAEEWVLMDDDTIIEDVEWIRVRKIFVDDPVYAFIHFSTPQRVKLSASVWLQSYQGESRIRNIHIDLHGNPTVSTAIPASGGVTYDLQTTNPGFASGESGTVFVEDTFTDSSGDSLATEHTGEVGADWTNHTNLSAQEVRISNANRARNDLGADGSGAYASGVPATAEYDVEAVFYVVTQVAGDSTSIWGRMATGAKTGYRVDYNVTAGAWRLYKVVAGVETSLGTYTQALSDSTSYTVKLELRDAAKKVYIDGVERISSADNAITDAGRVCLSFSAVAQSNVAGIHIDSITGTDAVAADTTPPVHASASLAADGVTLTWNLTEVDSPPVLPASGASGMVIKVDGVSRTYFSPTRTDNDTFEIVLTSPAFVGQTVTIEGANLDVTDSAASPNTMEDFGAQAVTNNSTATASNARYGLSRLFRPGFPPRLRRMIFR